jgi:hypothetical protein
MKKKCSSMNSFNYINIAPTGPAGFPAPHFNPAFFESGYGGADETVPVAPRGQRYFPSQ